MGYHSDLFIDVKIRKEKIGEFIQKLEDYREDKNIKEKYWEIEDLKIDNEGFIEYEDYNAKWYNIDDLIKFLKGYTTNGTIKLIGEDNERWGYEFYNDAVYEIEYIEERGKELFITELESLIKEAANYEIKNN